LPFERTTRIARAAFLIAAGCLAPALPAAAAIMSNQVIFNEGANRFSFFVSAGAVKHNRDGTFSQAVTARALVNGKIVGEVKGLAATAMNRADLVWGAPLGVLYVTGFEGDDPNGPKSGYQFGIQFTAPLPPTISHFVAYQTEVREKLAMVVESSAVLDSNAMGEKESVGGARLLRTHLIDDGSMPSVVGNPLERPVALFVGPPATNQGPAIILAAPAAALPTAAHFTVEGSPPEPESPGPTWQGATQPLSPPIDGRQFIPLPPDAPSGARLDVMLHFADGTFGSGFVIVP